MKKTNKKVDDGLDLIFQTSIVAIFLLYALGYIATAAIAITVAIVAKSVIWPIVIMIIGYKLIN